MSATKSARNPKIERYFKENPGKPESRSETRRDRDRLIYSSAFKRLSDVTQVVAANNAHVFHNRLTHSLQVAQVGRSITERLRDDAKRKKIGVDKVDFDPDAVEASCLAHDLGHPPFGHTAEEELKDLAKEHELEDGFEGNAQSFRVVTRLAFRSPDYRGLNLTRITLQGLLKYPWRRQGSGYKSKKWGAYDTEEEQLSWVKKPRAPSDDRRAIGAEIMDWADDVTYSVHDVEDFYRVGLIPLHLFAREDKYEIKRFLDYVFAKHRDEAGIWTRYSRLALEKAFLNRVVLFQLDHAYRGNKEDRSRLRRFAGKCIDDFVHAIELRPPAGPTPAFVEVDEGRVKEVALLKELTWFYVIDNPAMTIQQEGQRNTIRELFRCFLKAAEKGQTSIFPFLYQEMLGGTNAKEKARLVIDLIASMTERQAVAIHQRISGASLNASFERILD